MFGSNDQWIGLGVFFDSFDNDNKHNNPYIMAMTNDGTKLFDHQNDGATQQLAGCLRDFRLVYSTMIRWVPENKTILVVFLIQQFVFCFSLKIIPPSILKMIFFLPTFFKVCSSELLKINDFTGKHDFFGLN